MASLGIVLIGLALLLPWLFLRESFDTAITVSDLADLTPTAQAVISTRQLTALWFLENVVWISAILSTVGAMFLSVGVYLWAKKQRSIDQKEHLETEKLKLEVEKMSSAQILEKAVRETKEETLADELLFPSMPQPIRDYLRVEDTVINKLATCFGQSKVLSNRQIKDNEYDIILVSDRTYLNDVIFEVKATANRFDRGRVLNAINRLSNGIDAYTETTRRKVSGIVLLVLMGDKASNREMISKQQKMIENVTKAERVDLQILLITEIELMNLQCNELEAMIHPARYGQY